MKHQQPSTWCATGSASATVLRRGTFGVNHRKTIRHFHEPGHLHELTFSCYRRRPLLTNESWRELLCRSIDEAASETRMRLIAFVLMPEHVHMLVQPLEAAPALALFLARLKQPFSKQVKQLLTQSESPLLQQLTVQERPGKSCFRFWQEGPGYDRNLMTPAAIHAAIDYLHANPVRRSLCVRPTDWRWSSARFYHGQPPRQQDSALPFVHGLEYGMLE